MQGCLSKNCSKVGSLQPAMSSPSQFVPSSLAQLGDLMESPGVMPMMHASPACPSPENGLDGIFPGHQEYHEETTEEHAEGQQKVTLVTTCMHIDDQLACSAVSLCLCTHVRTCDVSDTLDTYHLPVRNESSCALASAFSSSMGCLVSSVVMCTVWCAGEFCGHHHGGHEEDPGGGCAPVLLSKCEHPSATSGTGSMGMLSGGGVARSARISRLTCTTLHAWVMAARTSAGMFRDGLHATPRPPYDPHSPHGHALCRKTSS